MVERSFIDVSTIAGGGFVSYASIFGEVENWLGLVLVMFTLVLTAIRILIAIKEWRKR
ncbi:MAG: hypothetical protein OCD03_13525 [Hyphomicrobiales bacterium]